MHRSAFAHAVSALVFSAFAASPALAIPVAVDLTGWTQEGSGTWTVQTGNDSVLQTSNADPGVFYGPDNALGQLLHGTIKVQTTSDDDFIGFVLGFVGGDLTAPTASTAYLLVDWKQNDQSPAVDGLAISLVTGGILGGLTNNAWQHTGTVSEIARGTNLGSTGWADNTEYSFDLEYTASRVRIYVDGVLEIDITATDAGLSQFTAGAFGFYNYSQSNVLYAGITEANASVPLPATLPMLGVALGGLGLFVRRRSAA
ncbi:hypothetical protein P2H44_07640 [Albimonas sp. CAU 1670]|uniref:PEP-CTERM sorting domain-containing protein n=1 Tax=Albimonas sp. CAU 1670 TaxID=3032599 RepID=UPI0023D9E5E0|nr:PEP-CTERM sorting domain-containing protein [Albimonas sp. CAU 1670]MDF2232421.1 hypothetical protein [Albimonas sp. CAU 1670]